MQFKVLNEEKAVHLVRDNALKFNRGNSQKNEHGNAKDSKAGMISCQFCVTNEAVVLHMERLVTLAKGLTILQEYARLKKRRFMQWTKMVPVMNRQSLLLL